jgi:hypothetical protein
VSARPAPGKHRHDQRPGVPGDADGARRQGCLATEKGHRHPVLEKVVIDDEPGDLAPAQRADDAAHATRGRLDHRHQVRVPEVGDAVEHEARGRPPRDDGHRHPLRGNGVSEQIESAHVRGGDNDPLATRVGVTQDGEILDRDRHECSQLRGHEMFEPEQLAEIPR